MAEDLREVLGRFVPQAVLDDAVEALKETDIAPEWWRSEMAKVAPDAKEAKELRAELESIRSAPKRKEALKRVGVDYDAVPLYGQKTLDALPADKLDDLDFVAQFVKEEGFEATLSPEQEVQERSGAEEMTHQQTSMGNGQPVRTGQQAADEAFYADLDAVPDGDKEGVRKVLEKHGRLAPTDG